jgi:hypothetical protein
MQEANLLGLQEMKNTPDIGAEDLKDQGMAMGAKMGGFDPVNRLFSWESRHSACLACLKCNCNRQLPFG